MFIVAFSPIESFSFWFAVFTFLIVSLFSIGKSYLRLKAVKLVLKDYENELNKQFWTQNTLWIFSPAIFFYNSICALVFEKNRLARNQIQTRIAFSDIKDQEKVIANKSGKC